MWEEFQRYSQVEGSERILENAFTGGRKRGDVNILITTDLAAIVNKENEFCKRLLQAMNYFVIGNVSSKAARDALCDQRQCWEIADELARIAKAGERRGRHNNQSAYQDPYNHAFCILLPSKETAVVQAQVPPAVLKARLFSTGVETVGKKKKKIGDDLFD
ncbi:hypothetical protein AGMMS49975_27090 [Clostridia bacterium]|nr:hypothetical protein AGMMS49975_27090 [Clostridia bacterium]